MSTVAINGPFTFLGSRHESEQVPPHPYSKLKVRHVEGLFIIAVEFEVVWHSPRVPAGTVSPEGHSALGDLFAIGTCNENSRYNLIITQFGADGG